MKPAWSWTDGRGTNRICDGPYEESLTWPHTGCEKCGHTEAEHQLDKPLSLLGH